MFVFCSRFCKLLIWLELIVKILIGMLVLFKDYLDIWVNELYFFKRDDFFFLICVGRMKICWKGLLFLKVYFFWGVSGMEGVCFIK